MGAYELQSGPFTGTHTVYVDSSNTVEDDEATYGLFDCAIGVDLSLCLLLLLNRHREKKGWTEEDRET